MWQRHLLVITEDCDFAHDKHRGRVTCVPLLRADEYLLELQVPRIRENSSAPNYSPDLRRILVAVGAPNVSDDRHRAWPHETVVTEIVASLSLTGNDAEVANSALEAVRLLGQPCASLDDAVHNLMDAQLGGPNPQSAATSSRPLPRH
jgi:hypothetical protein